MLFLLLPYHGNYGNSEYCSQVLKTPINLYLGCYGNSE
uniref:Uncharacterized protein n=1 Tax=Rhizophora mucronata TaxID=61149 RepID=A0A2P2IXU0_RHIMU